MKRLLKLSTFLIFLCSYSQIDACTRALFTGSDQVVITGRSMDWVEDMDAALWVYPRGVKRDGAAGPKSLTWVVKYGNVTVSAYNAGTADGMNETGLVANVLYLAESNYGKPREDKPFLSISLWAQYVLDSFASVAEAVDALNKEPFTLLAPTLPNGAPAQLHLSLSDPTGDSAIFEYINGKLVIHHGKQYAVMTNSPIFDKQLTLNSYWNEIGGLTFLPGTNRAADRFARASFLLSAIPKEADSHYIKAVPGQDFGNQALSSVLGIIRSVSVPLGISTPGEPNIASTLWRTIADHKNKLYFFDSATSPSVFWVRIEDLDLNEGAPIKQLLTSNGEIYFGNTASLFKAAEPMTFLPAKP